MSKVSLTNFLIGFFLIFISASSGAFLANEISIKYISENNILDSWSSLIQKSAHGHTNLFAIIHICFGLTFPYSVANKLVKKLQTVGLFLGSFAMSVLMMVRSFYPPVSQTDYLGFIIGIFLSAALVALLTHMLGIGIRYLRFQD